jgi:hypothetical protein
MTMADPATTASTYRQEANGRRQMAERMTDETQRNRILQEAQALDDLAQALEEAAPT